MGKTYNTQWALEEAVSHCTHPDLDAADVLLLWKIAHHCKHGNGCGAHAGNRDMAAVLRKSERTTDYRLQKLIRLKLIERTFAAVGRGKASEYRICLESDFYPPEKTRNPHDAISKDKTRNPDDAISDGKRATEEPKTRNAEPENAQSQRENAQPELRTNNTQQEPTKAQHTHAGALTSFSEASRYLPPEMLTGWKNGEKEALGNLAAEHGWEKIVIAARCFWQRQPDGAERTIFKWGGFLEASPHWLSKATDAGLVDFAEERFRTEHPEEYKRRMDAIIRRGEAEAAANFPFPPPEPSPQEVDAFVLGGM